MASSIAFSNSTVARGAGDAVTGSNFLPGRTVVFYVNGQYAGVKPSGPHDLVAYGALKGILGIPDATKIPHAGAVPVCAQDNTSGVDATASLTLT